MKNKMSSATDQPGEDKKKRTTLTSLCALHTSPQSFIPLLAYITKISSYAYLCVCVVAALFAKENRGKSSRKPH
jgi:hypothetical protein